MKRRLILEGLWRRRGWGESDRKKAKMRYLPYNCHPNLQLPETRIKWKVMMLKYQICESKHHSQRTSQTWHLQRVMRSSLQTQHPHPDLLSSPPLQPNSRNHPPLLHHHLAPISWSLESLTMWDLPQPTLAIWMGGKTQVGFCVCFFFFTFHQFLVGIEVDEIVMMVEEIMYLLEKYLKKV